MTVTLTRFASTPTLPWKNGLGVTTQLAIHPDGATAEAFEWRVSIARLDGSAAFSVFPGVERCLAMLQGEMTLIRADHAPVTLTPESQPLTFVGTVPTVGRVEGGSALDLNLMYRVPDWTAKMTRMTSATEMTLRGQATVLLCALVQARIGIGTERYELGRFDLLRVDARSIDRNAVLETAGGIDAYLIELRRRPS